MYIQQHFKIFKSVNKTPFLNDNYSPKWWWVVVF